MTRVLVTGGAGFVGSHLCDRLVAQGHTVIAFDDLSTGTLSSLAGVLDSPRFSLCRGDVLDPEPLRQAMAGCDLVYHLAANADVRFGMEDVRCDLNANTLGTLAVLEAAVDCDVQHLTLASSCAVYGEATVFPTPEDGPFPVHTSLYGASKVAAESFATAFATGFGLGVSVCRLVSVLGERYSHGHVVDFVTSLMGDPRHLTVLGDGYQTKAYVHVDDCVAGLLAATGESFGTIGIYNVAGEGTMTVRESLSWTCEELGVDPEVRFTGGERGWIGDSPRIEVSTARLRKTGWAPTVPLREAVVRTVRDVRRHLCLAAGSVRPGGGLDGGGPA